MNEKVRNLLQLYENTLAEHGFARRREERTAQTNEHELSHARWMLDKMMQDAGGEGWSDRKVNRWLGFIQGILWTNKVFGIPNMRDQSMNLYDEPEEQTEPELEPAATAE